MVQHSAIDHTGVTGVPSGSVATDPIFDAKGDLPVGTGANTAAKLTVGANDLLLMAASGESTGLKWAGGYTSWSPALTATSVSPTMGSGSTATGRYLVLGDHVVAQAAVFFGSSGVAAGTGSYQLSLPVNARTPSSGDGNLLGTCYIFDSSASAIRQGIVIYAAAALANIRIYDGTVVTNAAPWTWAASDALIFNFSYEAA